MCDICWWKELQMWNVRCVDQTNCKEPIAQPFPMVIDQWYVTIGFCGIWPSMVRMFLITNDMHRLKSMVSHGAKVSDVLYDQWHAYCMCWNLRNLIRIDEILWYLIRLCLYAEVFWIKLSHWDSLESIKMEQSLFFIQFYPSLFFFIKNWFRLKAMVKIRAAFFNGLKRQRKWKII